MFPTGYFPDRFFNPRYWVKTGVNIVILQLLLEMDVQYPNVFELELSDPTALEMDVQFANVLELDLEDPTTLEMDVSTPNIIELDLNI